MTSEHETYFFKHLPGILRNIVIATEAVARLHEAGEVQASSSMERVALPTRLLNGT